MWINIVEMAYKTVKGWMSTQINATGNKDFIAKWNVVFTTIEGLWAELKTHLAAKK